MAMSREQFSEQYRAFFPEATDAEIDKIYDEAKALVEDTVSKAKNAVGGSSFRGGREAPTSITKDDLAKVDWQAFAEVLLSSTIQRYVNYWLLKSAASKVLGRKVTFKEVYFAAMAVRALTRVVTEVGVTRVSVENDMLTKLKKAMEPVTSKIK
jgi:hypothetical protein